MKREKNISKTEYKSRILGEGYNGFERFLRSASQWFTLNLLHQLAWFFYSPSSSFRRAYLNTYIHRPGFTLPPFSIKKEKKENLIIPIPFPPKGVGFKSMPRATAITCFYFLYGGAWAVFGPINKKFLTSHFPFNSSGKKVEFQLSLIQWKLEIHFENLFEKSGERHKIHLPMD